MNNILHNAFSGNPKQSKTGFLTQFFPYPPGRCMRYGPARQKSSNILLSDNWHLQTAIKQNERAGRQNGNLVEANPSLKTGLGCELSVTACRPHFS